MVEIEEIEDSDPEEMDIDEYDDHDPAPLRPAAPRPAQPPATTLMNPANIPMQAQNNGMRPAPTTQSTPEENKERSKHWQCLYPVYFDKNKTRAEGRRVGKELAVANPLARELAEAVASLEYNVVFEPNKTHPKDWSNPGRCRVLVKEDGKAVRGIIKNKHHLYIKISEYLKAHPVTVQTPLKLKLPGMPPMKEPNPAPAVPRGWKMNKILPFHSAAVTGGGVSENFFNDMMKEMQGLGGGQAPGGTVDAAPPAPAPSSGKPKKEKRKFIRG